MKLINIPLTTNAKYFSRAFYPNKSSNACRHIARCHGLQYL